MRVFCMWLMLDLLSLAAASATPGSGATPLSWEMRDVPLTEALSRFCTETGWTVAAMAPQPEPLLNLALQSASPEAALQEIARQASLEVVVVAAGRAAALAPQPEHSPLPWIRRYVRERKGQAVLDFARSLSQEQREQLLGGGKIRIADLMPEQQAKAAATWEDSPSFQRLWPQGRERGEVTLRYRPRILFLDRRSRLLGTEVDVVQANAALAENTRPPWPGAAPAPGPMPDEGLPGAAPVGASPPSVAVLDSADEAMVVVAQPASRPLRQWVDLLRQVTGRELHLDRRADEVGVFLCPGRHTAQSAIRLLGAATGMELRAVGGLRLLAPPLGAFTTPAMERLREQLLAVLPPDGSDVKPAQLQPWEGEQFIASARLAPSDLTPEQMTWITRARSLLADPAPWEQIAELQMIPSYALLVDTKADVPFRKTEDPISHTVRYEVQGPRGFLTRSW